MTYPIFHTETIVYDSILQSVLVVSEQSDLGENLKPDDPCQQKT